MAHNKKSGYKPSSGESSAISLLTQEKTRWERELVQVTWNIQMDMRERINRARQYYWGVYETPNDSNNNEKKWTGLTFNFTEVFVRNSDLDTKDINVKAKGADDFNKANISRFVLRYFLDKINFGDFINDFIRRFFIDGTAIVKSLKGVGGKVLNTYCVDLLNFYIDPTAQDIQSANSVIERHILDIDEFQKYDWKNKEYVLGQEAVRKYYDVDNISSSKVPQVVVYERWGKMPKYVLTENPEDKKVWIDGIIIASGIEGGETIVHHVAENKTGLKPYEEAWCVRGLNRWHGIGIPEMLFDVQEQLNEILHIRMNNARILQNGLFKARIGSGITQQMLSRLSDGGVIPVKQMNDLEQLNVNDFRSSSYQMEDRFYNWAQRVTGGFQFPGAGEPLPASTPATIGLLQQQNARTAFDQAQENLGLALKRIVKNHWLPIFFESLTAEEVLRITGNPDEIQALDEDYINSEFNKAIIQFVIQAGQLPEEDLVTALKNSAYEKLRKFGNDRFVKVKKELFDFDYDIDVVVTNEIFDKVTMISQLRQLLVELSQIPNLGLDMAELAKEIMDFMGIGGKRFFKERPIPLQQMQPQAQPQMRRAQQTPIERTTQMAGRMAEALP